MQGMQDKEIVFHVLPTILMAWKLLMVLGYIEKVSFAMKSPMAISFVEDWDPKTTKVGKTWLIISTLMEVNVNMLYIGKICNKVKSGKRN